MSTHQRQMTVYQQVDSHFTVAMLTHQGSDVDNNIEGNKNNDMNIGGPPVV